MSALPGPDLDRVGLCARQTAGLQVSDRISLRLGGDAELLEAVRAHEGFVAAETLAAGGVTYSAADGEAVTVDGRPLRIAVAVS